MTATRAKKGSGCVFKRPDSGVFWLKYSKNGKPFRESSGTTNREKAEKKLKVRLSQIITGTFTEPKSEKTVLRNLQRIFFASIASMSARALTMRRPAGICT